MYQIVGARGKIDNKERFIEQVKRLCKKYDIEIQVLNASFVCGKEHLVSAVEHALRAFKRGENRAESLANELLLYASGERQIKTALEKVGIKNCDVQIAVVIIGECRVEELLNDLKLERDDSVLEWSKEALRLFGVGDDEIKAVDECRIQDLILERVALVDLHK